MFGTNAETDPSCRNTTQHRPAFQELERPGQRNLFIAAKDAPNLPRQQRIGQRRPRVAGAVEAALGAEDSQLEAGDADGSGGE